MDSDQFDRLAQWVGAGNRRQVLGSALGGAVALLGATSVPEVAAKRRVQSEGPCGNGGIKANRCKRNGQCCTGFCDKKKGKKPHGRCRCKQAGQSCQEDRNCCATAGLPMTCQDSICVSADPTPPPEPQCLPKTQTFGDTTPAANGGVTATTQDQNGYGGVYTGDDDIPNGTTFAELATLASDFDFETGTCGNGTPRFVIYFETEICTPIAQFPASSGCGVPNATGNTGNLIGNNTPSVWVILCQGSGNRMSTYDEVLALYASEVIVQIALVVDPSNGAQTVTVNPCVKVVPSS